VSTDTSISRPREEIPRLPVDEDRQDTRRLEAHTLNPNCAARGRPVPVGRDGRTAPISFGNYLV